MKKQLTKDITRFDDKMLLRLDGKTALAIGIGVLIAAPVGALLYFTAGTVPAVIVGIAVACAVVLLQLGTTGGMPLYKYILSTLLALLDPRSRRKPYSRQSGGTYERIMVLTVDEERTINETRKKKS